MVGLSTSGSISLGWALVAGRKRVPRPAAGKIALRTKDVRDPTVIGAPFDDNLYRGHDPGNHAGHRGTARACRRGRAPHPPRWWRGKVFHPGEDGPHR